MLPCRLLVPLELLGALNLLNLIWRSARVGGVLHNIRTRIVLRSARVGGALNHAMVGGMLGKKRGVFVSRIPAHSML